MDQQLAVFKGRRYLNLQGVRGSPVLANDELQSGPHGVDGSHLDIDEIKRKGLAANNVFGDLGRDFRRFFRPGHTDHAVWIKRLLQLDQVGSELSTACHESMDRVEGLGGKFRIPTVRLDDFGEEDAFGE